VSGLPNGWASATLGDLGIEVRGSLVPVAHGDYELYSVPTYPSGKPEILPGSEIGSSKRPVEPGDILLCKINPRINRVWMVSPPISKGVQIASPEYLVFRVANADLSRYLMWYFHSPEFRAWIELAVEGATGSHTRAKSGPILDQVIPIPPLNEQRRIVAAVEKYLSRLDAGVAAIESALLRIDQWVNATVQASLNAVSDTRGAEEVLLGDICERVTKGTTPTSIGHRYTDEGINFVKVESLVEGRVVHSKCAHISEEAHAELERSQLQIHDVLVSIAGTLGRVGIVSNSDVPANTNQALAIVRLRDPFLSDFVMAWLESPSIQRALQGGGKGVGMGNLTLEQIRNLRLVLPTPGQRHSALERINDAKGAHSRVRSALAEQLARADRLRPSILSMAFSGELVPQDPADEAASVLLERIAAQRPDSRSPIRSRSSGTRRQRVT
jgi:type I restriction enzyme S subunit